MSRRHLVVLTGEAESDIDASWEWIAQSDPWGADHWRDGLLDAIEGLSLMPSRFPVAAESRFGHYPGELRQMLHGSGFWKYRILFAVDGSQVVVVNIRHGARLYRGQKGPKFEQGEE